jgi:hypothetical protein
MSTARGFAAALVLAVAAIPLHARAASGYDLSDMWWNPGESGWGVDFVQQRDVIVATVYVQGPDGRPVWYNGALAFQGLQPQTHQITYSGDIYESDGAWFGATPYMRTGVRKVGTMTVVAPTRTTATVTYSVDGVEVTKSIQRYTFRHEQFGTQYAGTQQVVLSKCDNPADDGTRVQHVSYSVAFDALRMTIVSSDGAKTCTYAGPYSQQGHLGRLDSAYSCSTGEAGALAFDEISVQRFGIVGQLFGANNRGCRIEGSFAAVAQ